MAAEIKEVDVMYRLYVAKDGGLRIINGVDKKKENMVYSRDITDMTFDGIGVDNDLNGLFTGHGGGLKTFRNKIIFRD